MRIIIALMMAILAIVTAPRPSRAIVPKEYVGHEVIFTDPLFEDWTQASGKGTTALFDHNNQKMIIEDVCGKISSTSTYIGRAYDNHKGWDRNIPNDGGNYVIFAVAPGKVENMATGCTDGDTSCGGGAGNFVRIRHNDIVVSKYFHLKKGKIFVQPGQWVDRFTPLAVGDNTGKSFGAHLHLQIEVNDIPVDPLELGSNWSPPLVINLDNCLQDKDPQHTLVTYESLRNFAKKLIGPAKTALMSEGNFVMNKELHWLLGSGGSDPKDILVEEYLDSKGKNTWILFDLEGNAPWPIRLNPPELAAWLKNQSVYVYGKPLAAYPANPDTGLAEIDFEKGYIRTTWIGGGKVQEDDFYPEGACPGMFSDGWKNGKSYAIVDSFAKNGGGVSVGYPTGKDAKTPFVHEWSGYWLQDFGGGGLGSCGIMLQNVSDVKVAGTASNPFKAFLIKGAFWNQYRAPNKGPALFGAPLGDAYFDEMLQMNRQDFEKGKSILASGEIIDSASSCLDTPPPSGGNCVCPGLTKETPCGACGNQKWICKNYTWVPDGICQGQGLCALSDKETVPCGSCGGTKTRYCNSKCGWNDWSACNKLPETEVCDGLDNNCNGLTDEENVCCNKQKEVCNGVDDNCNGQTDEGVQNACGGCEKLAATVGAPCGKCGTFACKGTGLACTSDVTNVCGGCKLLSANPGDSCGKGGSVVCDGQDGVLCKEPSPPDPPKNPDPPKPPDPPKDPPPKDPPPAPKNACGGTSTLSAQPGMSCGTCGVYACKNGNPNAVTCTNDTPNVCGGCSSLMYAPGTPCGQNGTYICDGGSNVICKEAPKPPDPPKDPPKDPPPNPPPNPPPAPKNACGGTSTLSAQPGTPCDKCGTWQCSGQNNVTCASQGVCIPNQGGATLTCGKSGSLCGAGIQTQVCNNQCQWELSSCSAQTSGYAIDTAKACGSKFCIQFISVSGGAATLRLSKANGGTFSGQAIEWAIMNGATGQTMAIPKGFGCDNVYIGQSEVAVSVNLVTVSGKTPVYAEVYSGYKCGSQEITPVVFVEKCAP